MGRYRIQRALDSGGMGTVYVAINTDTSSEVALKFLLKDEPEARARLEREARSAARIWHRNVVRIHRLDYFGGEPFIVSEYVAGTDLKSFKFSILEDALVVLRQIADGLAAAHAAEIIHRDIKPANILLRSDGTPVIVDFGLGKKTIATGSGLNERQLTEKGTILGTPCYMSPEQVHEENLDLATDIFSFGLVAFEVLTGRSLFRRSTTLATLLAVWKDDIPRLIDVCPELPPHIAAVLDRCLLRKSTDRPRAAEVAKRLDTLAEVVVRRRDVGRRLSSGAQSLNARSPIVPSESAASNRLVAAAVEGMKQQASDREARVRAGVEEITRILNNLAPNPAGNVDDLLQSLEFTIDIVCDASKLAYAIAKTPDQATIHAQYKGLERLLEAYDRPGDDGSHGSLDLDYFRFLGHELVLTQIAALIREKRWSEIDDVLSVELVRGRAEATEIVFFDRFSEYLQALQAFASQHNRVSPHADWLLQRHNREPLSLEMPLMDLIAADFFLFLRTEQLATGFLWRPWRPWSTLYLREAPRFVLDVERDGAVEAVARALHIPKSEGIRDHMLQRAARLADYWKMGLLSMPLQAEELEQIGRESRATKA